MTFDPSDFAQFGFAALVTGYLLWQQTSQNKFFQGLFNDLKKSLNNNTKALEDLGKLISKDEKD